MKNPFEHIFADSREKELRESVNVDALHARMESERLAADKYYSRAVIEALMNLGLEIGDQASDFDTVLSDDASGRLPSLFFRSIIDVARKKEGKDPVQTFFIAGGFIDSKRESEVNAFIERKKQELGRTLLVTEYVFSGGSVRQLMQMLRKNGIDFDVAVLSSLKDEKTLAKNAASSSRIHIGEMGDSAAGAFYGHDRASGVDKRYESEGSAHPKRYDGADREEMTKARNDMKILAGEVTRLLTREDSEESLDQAA